MSADARPSPARAEWLSQRRHAVLITARKDGTAQSSNVAMRYWPRENCFRVSVTDGRAKTRNLRVGDWTQQWLNLRYVVRLLSRVGAATEAAELHRYLVAAGKPSPLDESGKSSAAAQSNPALSGGEAVDLARVTLNQWV